MSTISMAEQLACAQRELRMRQRVYPRLIRQKNLTAVEAAHQIAAMAAIVKTLQSLVGQEVGQMGLFR